MTTAHATTTDLRTQMDLLRLSKLIDCCQLLASHLREYAITPSHFDEDAFGDLQTANTVVYEASLALARLQGPQGHPDADPFCPCSGDYVRPGHVCN
jgi:hypothetical protein